MSSQQIDLSLVTGVSVEEALERVLLMAEDLHFRRLDGADDHGLNALCLEIIAWHMETLLDD